MSYLKLQIVGNLGGDATLNDVNGKKVLNCNVAHSYKFSDATGAQQTKTTWVKVAYWNDNCVRLAPYLKKGTVVMFEGIPDTSYYVDNQNRTIVQLNLRATQCVLIDSRGANQQQPSSDSSNNTNSNHTPQPQAQENRSNNNQWTPQQQSANIEPMDDLPF